MTTTSNVALTVQIMRLEGHWEGEGKDHEAQKQVQHTDRDPQQAGRGGGGVHSVTRMRDPGGVTVLLCGGNKPWGTRKLHTEREVTRGQAGLACETTVHRRRWDVDRQTSFILKDLWIPHHMSHKNIFQEWRGKDIFKWRRKEHSLTADIL